jgi:mono/diheme cytochrome c family protein/glucose/arabinose dehydrogenase
MASHRPRRLPRPNFLGLAATLGACPATAIAQNGDVKDEAQPDLIAHLEIPDAPVLSPEQALEAFDLLPGFRIDLVAAEPLVEDPVSIVFDERGRLWVVEMRSYMPNADGHGEEIPTSRIQILEDRNADGVFEHATTFLDGLVMPRAIAPTHGGALLIEPPSLFFCPDEDRDGVADGKIDLGIDLGSFENPEHAPNGLIRTIDNRFALSDGSVLIEFDGRRATAISTPSHGQWGVAMDDFGRLFYTPNSESLRGDLLPKEYALRNPRQRWLEGVNWKVGLDTATFPVRVTPGVNRGYRPDTLRSDGTLSNLTAACGPVFNRGPLLGAEFAGDAFICEPAANAVKWLDVTEENGLPVARNALSDREFLASTDERFRPVALAIGPDGALYVADMYRGVIQHKTYMTTFLRKQVEERGLAAPIGLGRIWRITPEDRPPQPPRRVGGDLASLVEDLGDANGTVRDLAQRVLLEEHAGDRGLPRHLEQVVAASRDPLERLHAAWAVAGLPLDASSRTVALAMLSADEPDLRAAGVRMLERSLGTRDAFDAEPLASIERLMDDPDRMVRAQVALSLGAAGPRRVALLSAMACRDGDDRFIRSAILSAAHGVEPRLLAALVAERLGCDAADRATLDRRLRPMIAGLGSFILRGSETETGALLATIAAAGAEQPEIARWLAAPLAEHLRLDSPSPRTMTLPEEPTGWTAIVAAQRDGIPQLAACDARIDWPGKGTATAAAPRRLTAEEQRRFAQGKRLYIHCMGCHGIDGEGMGGTYPPLNGSTIVLGSPGILTRVLLHGIEGPVAVGGRTWDSAMVGAPVRGNDELAAIMTYVRRAWENNADPVDAAEVLRVKRATAGRLAPWTIAELEALEAP